jgi:hypothetical protein
VHGLFETANADLEPVHLAHADANRNDLVAIFEVEVTFDDLRLEVHTIAKHWDDMVFNTVTARTTIYRPSGHRDASAP